MIPATEALRLPSAQLTEEERTAAEVLEKAIDTHIRQHMEWRGCQIKITEVRLNVIAEINQRLKAAGYQADWHRMAERSQVTGEERLVGFLLVLAPLDEAYRAAAARGAA